MKVKIKTKNKLECKDNSLIGGLNWKKKKNKKKIKRIRSKLEETKHHKPRLNDGIENHQKPWQKGKEKIKIKRRKTKLKKINYI